MLLAVCVAGGVAGDVLLGVSYVPPKGLVILRSAGALPEPGSVTGLGVTPPAVGGGVATAGDEYPVSGVPASGCPPLTGVGGIPTIVVAALAALCWLGVRDDPLSRPEIAAAISDAEYEPVAAS